MTLEADLRVLSTEAHVLAGNLSSWLGGSNYPEVKECAERAVLKLHSLEKSRAETGVDLIGETKVRAACLLQSSTALNETRAEV